MIPAAVSVVPAASECQRLAQAERLEEVAGTVGPAPVEPADGLLGAVDSEWRPERRAKQKSSDSGVVTKR